MSAHPDHIGDRYEVLSLIGSGGMADVYVARDTQLGRRVAVKVLRDVSGSSRFRAEAQLLARLRHPALVGILDLGEFDGRPFLVLELVEGRTLADVARGSALPPGQVARVGEQIAGALAHCHRAGVLHRDVSPANVLVSDDGSAHLADFGIARLVENHPTMTAAGETLGTAPYLAPEQVEGKELSSAVDVYALGLVLLEGLTGTRAFDGPAAEAAMARLHRDPDVPSSLPATWRELLTAMTARSPDQRPSAEQAQTQLARLAESDSDVTRPLTVPLVLPGAGTAEKYPFALRLPVSRWRTTLWQLPVKAWVAIGVLVLLLVVVLLPDSGPERRPPLPTGVPPSVVDELQQLHDAVEGR